MPECAPANPLGTMLSLMSGHAIVRSISLIADLGIADLLADGPKSAAELASRCNVDEQMLFRVMRALAAVGVFVEAPGPRFALNTISECLLTDHPHTLRDFVRLRGDNMYWEAWHEFPQAVRAGDIAFERAHGCAHFDLLERRPEAGQLFHRGMRAYSTQVAAAVIRAYDFSGFHTVLDVGGGQGAFLATLLKAHPALRGKLFDLPAALEQSRSVLEAAGVAERCEIVPGDFFESLPTGADAAVLGRVIHNWDDDNCVRILKNCRAALPTGGRLLIIEYVVTDDADGVAAKLFDLQMLVLFGRARERSAEEYGQLLARAAFSLTRVITTPLGISVVEAEAIA